MSIDLIDEQDENRPRRIETRLTRLMLALGVSPGHNYNLKATRISVDTQRREVILPSLDVTLLDCANAVLAEGGDLQMGWSLVLRDRALGLVSFAD